MRTGQALLDAGDPAAALPWLERACRIAPGNATALLPLALALLALGDPRAADAFARLAAEDDVREVWLGLAAARQRRGDAAGAAAALAASLAGHALPPGPTDFADAIAAAVGAPGWCGLRGDGALVIRPAAPTLRPTLLADGRRLRGARVPPGTRTLRVVAGQADLLGSPIQAERIRRVEGFVAGRDGGLVGWAWHPGDAARDPVLRVHTEDGKRTVCRVVATDLGIVSPRPLARPRGFSVPAAQLAGIAGPLRVLGADGRDLLGSPLDPGLEARAAAAAAAAVARALPLPGRPARAVPWLPTRADIAVPPARAPRRPRRPVVVIVPVYRGTAMTLACLDAVFATVPAGTRVLVVDDATPEPALAEALDELSRQRRILLHRHARNRGFPAAVNSGLRAAALLPGVPDIVLLNSDTRPAPGWLDRLRAAVHAAPDIGTAAPLSNDASILGYPDPADPAPPPDSAEAARLAALAARVHGTATVDIPTSVGFCMYLRRECLAATGLFRTDVFGQGYGEENDFCLRAAHLGWRHVAVPGAYVAHLGGGSFGADRAELVARNIEVLERLHPGYQALIRAWHAADSLRPARRALDAARWAARRRGGRSARPVVIITHDSAGGVERAVRERCAALAAAGRRTIVLRPVVNLSADLQLHDNRYLPGQCVVGDGPDGGFPNLRFHLPDEFAALVALLRAERPEWIELNHLLGHHHSVVDLAKALHIPYDVRVHDYLWLCPRVNLIGTGRRYCGEPPVSVCVTCIADAGSDLEEPIGPVALRQRSAGDLAHARAIIAPSNDTASRLQRHFPGIAVRVEPHEDDSVLPPLRDIPPGPRRVAVIGAIGVAKGYDVLLACARDAVARDLPLSFTVIGHSEDDDRLLETGRIAITGPYDPGDALAQIRAQPVDLAWMPSVEPETWCFALGEALRAGLSVVAFDLGAQAERLRATGRGLLLPLGLQAQSINNALLALRTRAGDDYTARIETSPASTRPVRTRS